MKNEHQGMETPGGIMLGQQQQQQHFQELDSASKQQQYFEESSMSTPHILRKSLCGRKRKEIVSTKKILFVQFIFGTPWNCFMANDGLCILSS